MRAEPPSTPDPATIPEVGPVVDMGAIDVIDQRARRRAMESKTEGAVATATTPPGRTGQRRVVPTVVHTGDRASGPVSGVVERPLSSRGPGLTTSEPAQAAQSASAPSIIVSPRLTAGAPTAEPPLITPELPKALPQPAAAATASVRARPVPAPAPPRQPMDSLTGPSNRPVKRTRASIRPGTLLLAAAAILGVGFALTRGPSSSPEASVASRGADPVEREAASQASARPGADRAPANLTPPAPEAAPAAAAAPAATAPVAAPTAAVAGEPAAGQPVAAPGTVAAAEPGTAPAAQPQAPAAAIAAEPRPSPTPDRVEAETAAPAAKAPARTVNEAPKVAAGAVAPAAREVSQAQKKPMQETTPSAKADAPQDMPRAARQTPTANDAEPRVAQARAALPLASKETSDASDPGARYDNVPPKAAIETADRVVTERRYDHVPPKAAFAQAMAPEQKPMAPTAASAAEQRAAVEAARRYDHVPPRAAQVSNDSADSAPAAKAQDTTPLSGSPRIFLQSDPPGATVAIQGQARGKTPLSLELDGRVEVVLTHPDRRPATVVLEPGRGARWLSIPLDPL